MKLSTFQPSLRAMEVFLEEVKTKPLPLSPLIESVKAGIAQHPAIIEFLDVALQKNWISHYSELEVTLNEMYLLEGLASAMANNGKFVVEIQDHIIQERKALGIVPYSTLSTFFTVYKATGSFFEAIKTISVDPAITFNRYLNANHGKLLSPKQIADLDKQGIISFAEKRNLMKSATPGVLEDFSGIFLNIYEAAATEHKNGYKSNAFSAHVLVKTIQYSPSTSFIENNLVSPKTSEHSFYPSFYESVSNSENFYLKDNLNQSWINLYESWNFAFILSELDDLHLLVPKLLIPSVLSAKEGNYMYTRVITLWLAINHFTMRRLANTPQVKGPQLRREMSTAWGEINRKYAEQLVQETEGLANHNINRSYEEFFRVPALSLAKLLLDFGR